MIAGTGRMPYRSGTTAHPGIRWLAQYSRAAQGLHPPKGGAVDPTRARSLADLERTQIARRLRDPIQLKVARTGTQSLVAGLDVATPSPSDSLVAILGVQTRSFLVHDCGCAALNTRKGRGRCASRGVSGANLDPPICFRCSARSVRSLAPAQLGFCACRGDFSRAVELQGCLQFNRINRQRLPTTGPVRIGLQMDQSEFSPVGWKREALKQLFFRLDDVGATRKLPIPATNSEGPMEGHRFFPRTCCHLAPLGSRIEQRERTQIVPSSVRPAGSGAQPRSKH